MAQRVRNGVCSQFIIDGLCCSILLREGLLTLFPCSSTRPLPQTAVFMVCSSMGPHGVTSPASKPALVWAPLSVGPQVLPRVCSSAGFSQDHSLLQASTCSSCNCSCKGFWFFPLLICCPKGTTTTANGLGLGHGGSVLVASDIGSVREMGSF